MAYRSEIKFSISTASAALLESRLSHVLTADPHIRRDRSYTVSSLYFDDPKATALTDKLDGVEKRAKFRIRYYNNSMDFLRLEKKEKIGSLSQKTSLAVDQNSVQSLISGDVSLFYSAPEPLRELSFLIRERAFSPVITVDYTRRAFLYPAGNVRITLDSDVKASLYRGCLQDPLSARVPVLDPATSILEVKYDSFLPPFLSELICDIPRNNLAISKYAMCREIFL